MTINKTDFGQNFIWGTAQASYQTEGAWNIDGKSPSSWDTFSQKKGKIERNENGNTATDFYHRYEEDLNFLKSMNFKHFRFSLSWPRILPNGTGEINPKGVQFYHKVIDKCLELGLTPWVTIYHWDHPQTLENKGGWTNRKMVDWFSEYTEFVSKEYGSKVKNWMILNEPLTFTIMGYMLGEMAPGKKGINNFRKAVHHANLCQAKGGRIVRKNVTNANIGTTQFTSYIEAHTTKDTKAAERMDALINRLFIEPSLGMGYPESKLFFLKSMKKVMLPGDIEKMKFDFDFIGLQYYFRTVIKKSAFMPYVWAKEVPPIKRGAIANQMNGEVYPEGFYQLMKRFSDYPSIKKVIITENGSCFTDILKDGKVTDNERIEYFKSHLNQVIRAKNEGMKVDGYFVWSLTDNFEWDKGFRPRFGLVYVDYKNNLNRHIKDSGIWFKNLLK
ncbi:MAG: beta-glucosidase [Bacteroidales bacterium]|nr:beta-glucosidase [Bacteroidales bacterium]